MPQIQYPSAADLGLLHPAVAALTERWQVGIHGLGCFDRLKRGWTGGHVFWDVQTLVFFGMCQ